MTVVYAIVLDFLKEWKGIIKLSALANVIDTSTKVKWIGYGERIEWQSKNGLEINIPRLYSHEMPCEWAWTFKIENLKP